MQGGDGSVDVLDSAPVLIWRSGCDAKCDWFNRAWLDFTGRCMEEELGDGWTAGVHVDDIDRCRATYLNAFHARQPFEMEYRLRHHSGVYRWIVDVGIPQGTEAGKFRGYLGYCFDLSEHKRTQERLHRSEKLLLEAQEIAQIGHYVYDLAADTWQSSDVLDRIFGIGAEFPRDWAHWLELVAPEARMEMAEYLAARIVDRQPFDKEYPIIRHHDGAKCWVSGRGKFELDDEGKPVRLLGTIRDITEQNIAAARLQLSEERLRATLEQSVNVAVQWYDRQGRVLYWNSATEQLYGWTAAEALDKTLDQFMQSREPAARLSAMLAEIELTGKRVGPAEYPGYDRAGNRRWVQANVFPIPGDKDGPIYVCMEIDITGYKQAQEGIRESEIKYRTLFESANDGIFLCDAIGFLDCNEKGASMYGLAKEDVFGRSPTDLSPERQPDGRLSSEVAAEKIQAALAGEPQFFEWQSLHSDGSSFDVEITLNRIELGDSAYLQAIVRDITERKRAEGNLRLAHEAFMNTEEAIIVTDDRATILDVNPAFTKITGYARGEVLGCNPRILRSGRQAPTFFQELWHSLTAEGRWEGEFWNRRKDGTLYLQHSRISAVRDSKGRIARYVGLATDITLVRESQRRIEQLAYYDALTHLPNRTLLQDRLKHAMAHADRHQNLLAVCYLDLDDFKPINDTWGHKTGDELLVEMSRRMQSCVRAEDTVARLGGDEFVLLIGDANHIQEIEQIIDRVLSSIALPFRHGLMEASVTASIGVTIYPDDGQDPDTLIRQADHAMYLAKRDGRNRCKRFQLKAMDK
jgi:diguanylate cyclase (GGDEF)-like protein/PAS domain S-box-containing protein